MASEPVGHREAPLQAPAIAIFDLDGTITRSDTFLRFLIACLWRFPGRWHRAPALGIAVLQFAAKRRDNSWLKAYFLRHIIGGRSAAAVERHARAHVDAILATQVLDRARAEIARLKQEGATLVLASASPNIYVEALGRRLGFDEIPCTRIGRDDHGRWTGHIEGENCYGAAKKQRIDAYLASIGADWPDVVFYSDHHSDLPLLLAAGRSFAVNPTAKLAQAAAAAGIAILDWRGTTTRAAA